MTHGTQKINYLADNLCDVQQLRRREVGWAKFRKWNILQKVLTYIWIYQ